MRDPLLSIFGQGAGVRRTGAGPTRPIAAGLKLGPDHVEVIDQSHERCAALGVSRIELPDHSPLARGELARVRDGNLRLLQHAAPVMEMLHEQIINTESMVVLCDAAGTILHSIGDDNFLARASQVALQPGANWAEQTKGTNAVGTALIEEKPTLVHADEHYLHANHFLTCSAAPILDPHGNILGVLDVSGDHRSFHPHTMALVKMSVRMIENHWLTHDDRQQMRLHFHSRVEFIGTLMEGILAFNTEGRLVGANRVALELLGLSSMALRMHSLATLFDISLGALVDRFRSPLATPLAVRLPGDKTFHLQAHVNWPRWTRQAEARPDDKRPALIPAGWPSARPATPQALPAALRAQPGGADPQRPGDPMSGDDTATAAMPATPAPALASAPARTLEQLEIKAMHDAVAAAGGNIAEAARQLGISRNTIYRKLRWQQHA